MKLHVVTVLCLQAAASRAVAAPEKKGHRKYDGLDKFGCQFDSLIDGKILGILPFVGNFFKKAADTPKCREILGKLKKEQEDKYRNYKPKKGKKGKGKRR